MTILMLSEYFPPYDFGGSEWSVFYLAKGLKKMGYKAIILTPNYGNKKYEDKSGFKIIRFPFYKKLKKNQLAPFWQTNSCTRQILFTSSDNREISYEEKSGYYSSRLHSSMSFRNVYFKKWE